MSSGKSSRRLDSRPEVPRMPKTEVQNPPDAPEAPSSPLRPEAEKKMRAGQVKVRVFLDFLGRHVAALTFKYNCFDLDLNKVLMLALEKSENLRLAQKIKKNESHELRSLRDVRQSVSILQSENFTEESRSLEVLLDLFGSSKALSRISSDLLRILKSMEVQKLGKLEFLLENWKGLCVSSYDFSALTVTGLESPPSQLEQKYLAWSTALRTSLILARKFIVLSAEVSGLELLPENPRNITRYLQVPQIFVAVGMANEKEHNSQQPSTVNQFETSSWNENDKWKLPTMEIGDMDPKKMQQIPENGRQLILPPDVPQEKKIKKKSRHGKMKRK